MADMIKVLNTIRANASVLYQERVPEATQTNIVDVGNSIMDYQETENEFLKALVNKVAFTIVRNKIFKNPLAVLKKGGVPLGKNIEEIYVNPVTGDTFDPTGQTLLQQNIPDTLAIYHSMNRKGKYKVTVSHAQLVTAFTSYEALEKLLNTIINAMYSGDNLDEFLLMKELVASAISGGKVVTMSVAPVTDSTTAKDFVKAVKTIGLDMTFPKSDYNKYYDINSDIEGVNPCITWAPMEDQVLLIRGDIATSVDVELLAQAFNMSYAEFKQRMIIVDSFGSAKDCCALLCDEAFFQVYDNLMRVDGFHNGEGLYDNHILHHWQTYSLSLFANAVAFIAGKVFPSVGEKHLYNNETFVYMGETDYEGSIEGIPFPEPNEVHEWYYNPMVGAVYLFKGTGGWVITTLEEVGL